MEGLERGMVQGEGVVRLEELREGWRGEQVSEGERRERGEVAGVEECE